MFRRTLRLATAPDNLGCCQDLVNRLGLTQGWRGQTGALCVQEARYRGLWQASAGLEQSSPLEGRKSTDSTRDQDMKSIDVACPVKADVTTVLGMTLWKDCKSNIAPAASNLLADVAQKAGLRWSISIEGAIWVPELPLQDWYPSQSTCQSAGLVVPFPIRKRRIGSEDTLSIMHRLQQHYLHDSVALDDLRVMVYQ